MNKHIKGIVILSLLLRLVMELAMPVTVLAQGPEQKVVRVGFHEAPYFTS